VGIAGGIGITPFRAIAYEIARRHLPHTRLTLIYAARNTFAYQDELDRWQSDRVRIIYVHNRAEAERALTEQFAHLGNQASYYLSGTAAMLTELIATCQKLGAKNIVTDPFTGY
jgi:ferredoxin-NADP reductase